MLNVAADVSAFATHTPRVRTPVRPLKRHVRSEVMWKTCLHQTAQGISEFRASRINNGHVVKPGRTPMGWRTTLTFPGVQSDVMVITASGKEGRLGSITLREFKSEHIARKCKRPIEVRDFQMDV